IGKEQTYHCEKHNQKRHGVVADREELSMHMQ
ncbi:MAG: hypothetical protein RIT37_25, partial [Bacteroidota bacterium]